MENNNKPNKTFGYYIGVAVAWIFCMAIATCVAGLTIKLALMFLTWLF